MTGHEQDRFLAWLPAGGGIPGRAPTVPVMEPKPTTSDLLRLMPLLSEMDTDKGIDAVLNTLRDIGVMRFDPERGRLIFVAMEVSADLLDREISRRLDG